MLTRNKIIYLEQKIKDKHYDEKIYNIYEQLIQIRNSKINKLVYYNINNPSTSNNLSLLYNNLTQNDISMIESFFTSYYKNKLDEEIISKSQLFLNSIERFNTSDYFTNKLTPYQSYTSMICGLQIFKFSLYPLEYQPSGYCNFSQLKPEFQLTLSDNVDNILPNDIIRSYIIARSYNIIRFMSGICGIAW